ncbi:MAG: carbohydrate kinase family protein [Candidatus Aenigmatarchaeota archaeon]
MPDVVCIGAANVDIIGRVEDFPKPDHEVSVTGNVKLLAGGSAANVAVGLSRLGKSAGFVGILGTDQFADFLIKEFKKDGVDYSKTTKIAGTGGLVIATVNSKGERILFTSDGVAVNFKKENIPVDYIKNAKFLHMTSIIGENVVEAFEYASMVAKKAGVRVTMDPGTIFAKKPNEMRSIMKNCYAILPSEIEAEMLTGLKGEKAGKKLLEYGPEVVVIKQGDRGCTLITNTIIKKFPAVNANVLDTTGAGDSFSAGFISALLDKKSLEEACKFANRVAALSTTREGARGTPKKEELKFL